MEIEILTIDGREVPMIKELSPAFITAVEDLYANVSNSQTYRTLGLMGYPGTKGRALLKAAVGWVGDGEKPKLADLCPACNEHGAWHEKRKLEVLDRYEGREFGMLWNALSSCVFQAVESVRGEEGASIQILNQETGMGFWLDVCQEPERLTFDWHQKEFGDSEEDMLRKALQSSNNFKLAAGIAAAEMLDGL